MNSFNQSVTLRTNAARYVANPHLQDDVENNRNRRKADNARTRNHGATDKKRVEGGIVTDPILLLMQDCKNAAKFNTALNKFVSFSLWCFHRALKSCFISVSGFERRPNFSFDAFLRQRLALA